MREPVLFDDVQDSRFMKPALGMPPMGVERLKKITSAINLWPHWGRTFLRNSSFNGSFLRHKMLSIVIQTSQRKL